MAAAPSCAPSASPVTLALRTRLTIPSIALGPSLSSVAVTPGSLNALDSLPRGVNSKAPMKVPLIAAVPRSSSVAPYARARSLASPAPAPAATAPAKGNAAGPAKAAGARAAIEPIPADNLKATESSSAPLSISILKISCILLRALSSASSSRIVAIPKADDSNIPAMPEPNPLSMSSPILELEENVNPCSSRVGSLSLLTLD